MNIWDQLVDCICRPPRDVYSPAELLGGSRETFMIGAMECTRLDYELTNQQGMKLQCSHYFPLDARSADGKLPVVVYCHCNSGSRRDAEEAVYHLLPCGVGVVAFDFTGSGLSDGKWVTLGAHEVEDLGVVVRHLRSQGGISSIGLWGRSMGAVTALMYSHSDPDIAGMVLDSPFSRLTDLMLEIVVSQRLPIPKMMLKLALRLMRNSVRRKAGCDINTVSPLDVVPRAAIPAMFGHGEEDSFINIQHSVKLYEAYNSAAEAPAYKNMVRFRGDHNHPRPSFFYSSVCCFFHQQLKLDQVLLGGNPADTQQLMQYGSLTLSSAHDHLDRANGFINTPWTLEPVSALSPADEAAAAALLAAEGGYSNSGATPGSDGCAAAAAAGSSGSSGSSGGCADRISSHLQVAAKSSKGGAKSQAGAGVVHISEGGLNSPRVSPRRDGGRTMVAVDAGASSSGSSGGGMSRQAGAATGGGSSRHGSNGGLEGQHQQRRQQQRLSASPPGLSHMHQQQQHDSQHPRHHSHRHQQQQHNQQHRPQQQQQQRSFTSLEDMPDGQQPLLLQQQQLGYQQPDPSWQLASAVPVPPAAPGGRMQGSAAGALPVCPSDPLFTVGSRGAQDAVLGEAHAADAAGAGTGMGLHSLSKSAPGAPALSAAAGTEAILQQQAAAAASARPNSTGRGVSAAGSSSGSGAAAASAGGQHFKWLFKRTGSSGGGSTPSTSPPASAGVDAAVAAVERHRSHGSSLSNGSRADAGRLSAVLAPGAAAGVATAVQQQGQQQHQQQGQEGASQQQQQQQQTSHRSRGGGGSSGGGLPAAAGAGAAINGRAAVAPSSDVVSGACRSDLLTGAAGPEEEWVDPDIAAAIAASLADQQVLGQQQQQGPPPVLQTRQPHSLEEEEEMLREAIALSLALSDTPAQQQEQQQDGLQAQPPAVVPQQHEQEQQPSVLPSNP